MEPMDAISLWSRIEGLGHRNERNVEDYREKGRALAKAEYAYRTQLAKAIAEYRASGQPVTGMSDICRGRDDVAQLRLERDLLQSEHDAILQDINVSKKNQDMLDHQLSREWSVSR